MLILLYTSQYLYLCGPGKLPPGITAEKLKTVHESSPPNPLIAKPFFLAGLIENWGTGTNKILEECAKAGMPEPEFKDTGTCFVITFRKDIYTENFLTSLGLNERQIKAVRYVKENGKITNKEYQDANGVSRQTAARELSHLMQSNILTRHGETGRDTHYTLAAGNASQTPQTPNKRLTNASKGREKGETDEVPTTQKRKKKIGW